MITSLIVPRYQTFYGEDEGESVMLFTRKSEKKRVAANEE